MKFLIPVVVGAIIGYFTNWLAIKMLFRPHYEKRFMGIVMPFTPGLIPKEKARISHSIGVAVGQHLLSPETIAEVLSSEETNRQMKLWLEGTISRLKDSGKSIKESLENISMDGYNDFALMIKGALNNLIFTQIKGRKFKNAILDFIENKLNQDEMYDEIKEKIKILIYQFSESDEVGKLLESTIEKEFTKLSNDERTLGDMLPEAIILKINRYLDENSNKISNHIRGLISSPNMQDKLKVSIATMVNQNVSRLITSFISPETISEKVFSAIWNYIDNENSNQDIIVIIRSSLDRIMKVKVSNIAPQLLYNIDTKEVSKQILSYAINKETQDNIVDIIDEKLRSSNKENIVDQISVKLDIMLNSSELNNKVISLTDDIVDQFMNKPLSIIMDMADDNLLKIYDFTKIVFENFTRNELPRIIELFNVSKIVEDNINKFDVEFTEELILDIASKELKTITWLGALLGGIMGLLSPLLQML